MANPKWVDDIVRDSSGTPFGEITFRLKRHRHMTTEIESVTHSKLKYANNDDVFADIELLMHNLIDNGYVGKLQFEVTYTKPGLIEKVSIKNTKTVNYREQK